MQKTYINPQSDIHTGTHRCKLYFSLFTPLSPHTEVIPNGIPINQTLVCNYLGIPIQRWLYTKICSLLLGGYTTYLLKTHIYLPILSSSSSISCQRHRANSWTIYLHHQWSQLSLLFHQNLFQAV